LLAALVFACDQAPFLSPDPAHGGGGRAGATSAGGGQSLADPLAAVYPTPRVLVERAVAPSCANGVACHQVGGRALPALATFADLAATFGRRCQEAVADPRVVVDLCEPEPDFLQLGPAPEASLRLAAIEVDANEPTPPTEVTLVFVTDLDAAWLPGPDEPPREVSIERAPRPGWTTPAPVALSSRRLSIDPSAPRRARLALVDLPAEARALFDERVYPRPNDAVLVGDPNRNGVAGAALGGREVSPGDLSRSYLFQRLLSDDLGTRMPLVQGGWTDAETRALGCFLRSPVGADEAIVYATCPTDLAGQTSVDVRTVLTTQCATAACHSGASPTITPNLTPDAGLAARLVEVVSAQAAPRVLVSLTEVETSYLLCKIDPACGARAFSVMPKDGAPLSENARAAIRAWIASGAPDLSTTP
jgi:hypothetical protein